MTRMLLGFTILIMVAGVSVDAMAQVTCLYYRIDAGNRVEVHWCFSGRDDYGSEVQRRSDTGTYQTLANSFCPNEPVPLPQECVYTDESVTGGTWFYRIRMIALDGMVTYSDSIRVVMNLSQADYVIITPPEYVSTVLPLAAFRSTHNGFSVRIATTDSIYGQFGQGIPADSAIRQFITFALTSWENPKPLYFLLAGNVNAVPTHRELEPVLQQDSMSVDQWFVEGLDTVSPLRWPAAALGRFPAWNATQLQTMVTKTIAYESAPDSAWMSRVINVADYDSVVGFAFEQVASDFQAVLVNLWPDTVTVHVRPDSPLHLDRAQFRALWNEGAAMINFIGLINSYQFSNSAYFTTRDVDSLSNGNRLPFFFVQGIQHFDRPDTLAMAVNVLQAPSKGAIGSLAPYAEVYATDGYSFAVGIYLEIIANPRVPIGKSILLVRRGGQSEDNRKYTLLCDPALVIKNPLVAHVQPEPGIPGEFALSQNYPNPFNPSTKIRFSVPQGATRPRPHEADGQATGYILVTLKVYDVLGREVRTIVNEELNPGNYESVFDGAGLASGVYFYRLVSGAFVATQKLVLLR